MGYKGMLIGLVLPVGVFCQTAPKLGPIPGDPLELVTGPIQVVDSGSRAAVLQLLAQARSMYTLRGTGLNYDLKVSFTVDSNGQTDYDGAWEMEDQFEPHVGLRWTAKAAAGYSTTQISANQASYGESTTNLIPLRLQEARAALFGAIPLAADLQHDVIRTSTANFNGTQVTCVLLSGPGGAATATPGRRWEETEECIDPQSGTLQVHSQVPGRYYAYEYSNAVQFNGHPFPQKITVTEGGQAVSQISVQSLTSLRGSDPAMFAPTAEMRGRGQATALAPAQKIERFSTPGPYAAGATAQGVCVFGVLTPTGQLAEAHSLQPSDPNSAAAVAAAKQIDFSRTMRAGTRPQQHFVFIIEKFVTTQ